MAATDTAAREAIAHARKYLDSDTHLAAYVVRDLPETKAAQLDDLAWAMFFANAVSKNDVVGLLDKLEEYLDGKADHLPDDAQLRAQVGTVGCSA